MAINIKDVKIHGVKKGKTVKGIVTLLVILIILATLFFSFRVVPAGCSGVSVMLGQVSDNVLREGLHFKVPFVQKIEIVSNKIQNEEIEAAAVSKDLQSVSSKVAVNFRITNEMSAQVFKNISGNITETILLPAVQESMKSVSARYTAEELISKRQQVSEEIKGTLDSKVKEYGVFIERFNIVNFDFSPEFNAAIESKQVAEQNLIKTKTEQEQQIVIAEAEAKKQVIAAQAEADAITAKANAQADANKLLNESINENLLEYQKIQRWNGELPQVLGEGGTPIIDIR